MTTERSVYELCYAENSRPFGISYGQWTVKWWQWMFSFSNSRNPVNLTGDITNLYQAKQICFLVGSFGGKYTPFRRAMLPKGTSILFPVVNYEINTYENSLISNNTELVNDSRCDIDNILEKAAILDGRSLPLSRVPSDPQVFTMKVTANNCAGIPEGKIEASADGYWVFLRPLSPGKHHLYFYGLCPGDIKISAEYELLITD
jgi:hypothetical protein